MGQTGGALQNGAHLRFLSAADAHRAARTFRKLARHHVHRWALTGGFAIECHRPHGRRDLNDIDFVAPDFDSLPTTLADDFLFRHVHPSDPPGKTILQFIDPETAIRIDVFRACGGTLRRAVTADLQFCPLQIVSAADLLARQARVLLDLANGVSVAAKHARDYLRLVESVKPEEMVAAWRDHRRPSHPSEFCKVHSLIEDLIRSHPHLLIDPEYSRDAAEICPRCQCVVDFPLADSREILALLGYC